MHIEVLNVAEYFAAYPEKEYDFYIVEVGVNNFVKEFYPNFDCFRTRNRRFVLVCLIVGLLSKVVFWVLSKDVLSGDPRVAPDLGYFFFYRPIVF
jgi:hypothetical protein